VCGGKLGQRLLQAGNVFDIHSRLLRRVDLLEQAAEHLAGPTSTKELAPAAISDFMQSTQRTVPVT